MNDHAKSALYGGGGGMLRPIAGQPGLFREGPEIIREQKWQLEGLNALGDMPRLDAAWGAYTRLKDDTHALLARFPGANDPTDFVSLVRRISELPRNSGAVVRLTASQVATILKGALSSIVQNLGMAYTIAGGPRSGARGRELLKLVETAENVTRGTRAIVDSMTVVAEAAEVSARQVHLSGSRGGLGNVALLIVAGVIALVEVTALIALIGFIAVAVSAHIAATRACQMDAAAGHPCSGAEYEAYRSRAAADAATFGIVPNIAGMFQQASDAASNVIFYGGMLAVVAGLGYLAYVGAPAAREARSWAHEEAASARSRRAASRTRAGYR